MSSTSQTTTAVATTTFVPYIPSEAEEALIMAQIAHNDVNPYINLGKNINQIECRRETTWTRICECSQCRRADAKLRNDTEIAIEYSNNLHQRELEREEMDRLTQRERQERLHNLTYYPDQLPLYTPGNRPKDPPSYEYVTEVLDVPPPPPYTTRYWGPGCEFLTPKIVHNPDMDRSFRRVIFEAFRDFFI